MVVRVLRDTAQAEEIAQEVLVEVWRTATRYDPARGGAMAMANQQRLQCPYAEISERAPERRLWQDIAD
jgi:hypothetical protein